MADRGSSVRDPLAQDAGQPGCGDRWRPRSTAPDDEVEIVGYQPEIGDANADEMPSHYGITTGKWLCSGGWGACTHWMPLAPPQRERVSLGDTSSQDTPAPSVDGLQAEIRRLRDCIVSARWRLTKGRALWNGPCHECDAALHGALTGREPPSDTRRAAIEECVRFIEGGRFLHDDAPPKRFATEVVAGIRRELSPQPERVSPGDTSNTGAAQENNPELPRPRSPAGEGRLIGVSSLDLAGPSARTEPATSLGEPA